MVRRIFVLCVICCCCTCAANNNSAGKIDLKLIDETNNDFSSRPPFAFDYSARSCAPGRRSEKDGNRLVCDFPTDYYWNGKHVWSSSPIRETFDKIFPDVSAIKDRLQDRNSRIASENDPAVMLDIIANQPLINMINKMFENDEINANLMTGIKTVNISVFDVDGRLGRKQTLPKVAYFLGQLTDFSTPNTLTLHCTASVNAETQTMDLAYFTYLYLEWRHPGRVFAIPDRVKIVQKQETQKYRLFATLTVRNLRRSDSGQYACYVEARAENGTGMILLESEKYEIEVYDFFTGEGIGFRRFMPSGTVHVDERDTFTFNIIYQDFLGFSFPFRKSKWLGKLLNETGETTEELTTATEQTATEVTSRCESVPFNYKARILNCTLTITLFNVKYEDSTQFDMYKSETIDAHDTPAFNKDESLAIIVRSQQLRARLSVADRNGTRRTLEAIQQDQVFMETDREYTLTCHVNSPLSNTTVVRLEHMSLLNGTSGWKEIGKFYDDTDGDAQFVARAEALIYASESAEMLYRCSAARNDRSTEERSEDTLIIVINDVSITAPDSPVSWIGFRAADIVEWNEAIGQPLLPISERRHVLPVIDGKLLQEEYLSIPISRITYAKKYTYYEGERLVLACRVPKRYLSTFKDADIPAWFLEDISKPKVPVTDWGYFSYETMSLEIPEYYQGNDAFVSLSQTTTRFDYGLLITVLLHFANLSSIHQENYRYLCISNYKNKSVAFRRDVELNVISPVKPFFEFEQDYPPAMINVPYGKKQFTLVCRPKGDPMPTVTWLKNGIPYSRNVSAGISLSLPMITESDEAVYSCKAQNKFGELVKNSKLTVSNAPVKQRTFIAIIIGTIAFSIILVSSLIGCIMRRTFKQKQELQAMRNELKSFASYNSNVEIARERFHIDLDRKLGEGAFGVVYSGHLIASKMDHFQAIAVKVPADGKNPFHQSMLLDELKIMLTIGQHVNVLSVIGACTADMVKGELYILMELCSMNSMEAYLMEESKLNNLTLSTVVSATQSTTEIGYRGFLVEEINRNFDANEYIPLVSSSIENVESLNNGNTAILQLSFALQTSNGMDYLGRKLIIHRDLAARNLLLTLQDGVIIVKIADYGLARQRQSYRLRGSEDNQPQILPVAWMAPESLLHGHFSVQTDVWAFGVVLWEIFTLGDKPDNDYENHLQPGAPETFTRRLSDFLQRDGRLSKPDKCAGSIFQLMSDCWAMNPDKRPSFQSCRSSILAELETLDQATNVSKLIEMLAFKKDIRIEMLSDSEDRNISASFSNDFVEDVAYGTESNIFPLINLY